MLAAFSCSTSPIAWKLLQCWKAISWQVVTNLFILHAQEEIATRKFASDSLEPLRAVAAENERLKVRCCGISIYQCMDPSIRPYADEWYLACIKASGLC